MRRGRPRKVLPKNVNVAFSLDVASRDRLVRLVDTGDYKSMSSLMRQIVLSALDDLERKSGIHSQVSMFSE